MEPEADGDTNRNWSTRNYLQRIGKRGWKSRKPEAIANIG